MRFEIKIYAYTKIFSLFFHAWVEYVFIAPITIIIIMKYTYAFTLWMIVRRIGHSIFLSPSHFPILLGNGTINFLPNTQNIFFSFMFSKKHKRYTTRIKYNEKVWWWYEELKMKRCEKRNNKNRSEYKWIEYKTKIVNWTYEWLNPHNIWQ